MMQFPFVRLFGMEQQQHARRQREHLRNAKLINTLLFIDAKRALLVLMLLLLGALFHVTFWGKFNLLEFTAAQKYVWLDFCRFLFHHK